MSGQQGADAVSFRCFEWNGIPCFSDFSRINRTFRVSLPLIRQSGLVLADLKALRMDLSEFQKYPSCQEGFLILEQQDKKNYLEINHFVKVFLERMLNQWITKKQQPK